MRTIGCLLLVGLMAAQDPSVVSERSHPPIPKKPFELSAYELPNQVRYINGTVDVEFIVNENGKVEDAIIIDTFNILYNDVILDKINQSEYYPAKQNGRPVRVRYRLPIAFK